MLPMNAARQHQNRPQQHRPQQSEYDRKRHRDEPCTLQCCGRRVRAKRRIKPQGLALLVAISFFCLRQFLNQPDTRNPFEDTSKQMDLKIFETLLYPLENAKLIGLYFGASQYPENRILRDTFWQDDRLLPSEGPVRRKTKKHPLAIVYVSSDNNDGSDEWITVSDPAEKTALHRRFHVCADCDALGIDSRFPHPNLFVIDTVSMAVITPGGLKDIQNEGSNALQRWLDFQQSIEGVDPAMWAATELFQDDNFGATATS